MKRLEKIKTFIQIPFVFLRTFFIGLIDVEFALILLKNWINKKRKY